MPSTHQHVIRVLPIFFKMTLMLIQPYKMKTGHFPGKKYGKEEANKDAVA